MKIKEIWLKNRLTDLGWTQMRAQVEKWTSWDGTSLIGCDHIALKTSKCFKWL